MRIFLIIKLRKNYELIISNLPYNISSQVLVKLSIMKISTNTLILMFQKNLLKDF